ncbi:Ide, partial [Symbiodinium sp. CCMP2456]
VMPVPRHSFRVFAQQVATSQNSARFNVALGRRVEQQPSWHWQRLAAAGVCAGLCSTKVGNHSRPAAASRCAVSTSAVTIEKPDTHRSRQYEYMLLKNGLQVVLASDPTCDKAAMALCVGVGRLHEPKDMPGLAHFCEHMLFLGTEKFPEEGEYKRFVKQHGGKCNASTGDDKTCYQFDVSPAFLEGAMDRFSQFFLTPLFTKSATEREINAVDSEHSMRISDDGRRSYASLLLDANPNHPLHWGSGNAKSLRDDPKERGVELHSEVIRPSVNSAPVVDIYHDVMNLGPSSPSLKGELLHSPSMAATPVKSLGFSQGNKEEKEEKVMDKLKRWINVLAATLVVLNSLVMMVELELEGNAIGTRIGLVDEAMPYEKVSPIFETLDSAFVFIFLAELIFRAFVEWATFMKEIAFWFDFFLVAAGFVDMYIIMPLASAGGLGGEHKNIVLLRLVRALKALRAIRMVRTLRLFTGLRLLVKACQCFLPSLGWSMVLLGVFMSMGALVLGTLLQDFILDPTNSLDDRQWVWMRYGTAYRALYTLYEITFAGNWPTNVRPVLDRAGHGFVIFFVVYITIIVFAVIRVISAIFLKDTLDAANNDAEHLVVERLRKKAEYVEKLEQVFHAMDDAGD